jgi:hypothetical protein
MSERERELALVLGDLVLRYSQLVQNWTPEHVLIVERAKAALAMPVVEPERERGPDYPSRPVESGDL